MQALLLPSKLIWLILADAINFYYESGVCNYLKMQFIVTYFGKFVKLTVRLRFTEIKNWAEIQQAIP
jgi:hypothetical protein